MQTPSPDPALLLALDLYEHARHRDRGAGAAAEGEASPAAIEWADLHARFQTLVQEASEPWAVEAADVAGSHVLDVRRVAAFEQAQTQLPRATWQNPAHVRQWVDGVPNDRRVTVYCVHGHEVSRATALQLRAAGVDARFLRGGIDGWSKAGRPVVPKGDDRL